MKITTIENIKEEQKLIFDRARNFPLINCCQLRQNVIKKAPSRIKK